MSTTTTSLRVRVAARIVKDHRRRAAEYNAEAAESLKEGYRPHYCIHGMNLWVEYDPICGPCEDGEFTRWVDGYELRRQALDLAAARLGEAWREVDPYHQAATIIRPVDPDLAEVLFNKATDTYVQRINALLGGTA